MKGRCRLINLLMLQIKDSDHSLCFCLCLSSLFQSRLTISELSVVTMGFSWRLDVDISELDRISIWDYLGNLTRNSSNLGGRPRK